MTNNGVYVTNDECFDAPLLFDQIVHELLTQVSSKAPVSPPFNAYAQRQPGVSNTDRIYGAAQRTNDLSASKCKICLDVATNKLLENSSTKKK